MSNETQLSKHGEEAVPSTVGSQAGSCGGRGSSAAPGHWTREGTTSGRPLPLRPLFLRQYDFPPTYAPHSPGCTRNNFTERSDAEKYREVMLNRGWDSPAFAHCEPNTGRSQLELQVYRELQIRDTTTKQKRQGFVNGQRELGTSTGVNKRYYIDTPTPYIGVEDPQGLQYAVSRW
ncbi:hypothetical protein B0H65DRAFT_577692 [Neurospora tetraspora]|uniref:Uncharacterized protein n=1 Tax=Neurospora tetraspora TaxID=94610 RepID=A0AAE0JAL5_9PEZI|nr:hypothetical protein B0H65DRAFT_577692 [Neurospora tetraspora]